MRRALSKSTIEIVYNFAKAGLLHHKRSCDFCGMGMVMKCEPMEPRYGFVWQCPGCFQRKKLVNSTPFTGLNLKKFDTCLELWLCHANPKTI